MLDLDSYNIENEIRMLIKQISFMTNNIETFKRAISSLELESKVVDSIKYHQTFQSFAWLLFIDFISGDVAVEETYLMASILYLLIRYSLDYIKPKKIKVK